MIAHSQGQNANDVYFAQLTEHSRSPGGYLPSLTIARESKKASQIRGKAWDDIVFTAEVDVHEEDLAFFASPTASAEDVSEHLGFMMSEARRKADVSLKNLTVEERKLSVTTI